MFSFWTSFFLWKYQPLGYTCWFSDMLVLFSFCYMLPVFPCSLTLMPLLTNPGVCFPLGKGMYRVVHIPEDEAVLLNSREKAPYLICVEVLKSEMPR